MILLGVVVLNPHLLLAAEVLLSLTRDPSTLWNPPQANAAFQATHAVALALIRYCESPKVDQL